MLKSSECLDTPVLFLIFNRPDLTKQVFEAIRQVKPKQLFIAADGPRIDRPQELELCEATRIMVMQQIDWDCKVYTLFRKTNLGCKIAVSSAISWFFEHVEEGIILEDDCFPSPTFFKFCEKLLKEYKYCQEICHIGGSCFLPISIKESFYFTKYTHIWGWATWKRAWMAYDIQMKEWPSIQKSMIFKEKFLSKNEFLFWAANFNSVYNGECDTWDYQWMYTTLANSTISVAPSKNLIKNIGFRADGTHVTDEKSSNANLAIFDFNIKDMLFPDKIQINKKLDKYIHDNYFGLKKRRINSIIIFFRRIRNYFLK